MKEEGVFSVWSLACGWNYDRWGNSQIMEGLDDQVAVMGKLRTILIPFLFLSTQI